MLIFAIMKKNQKFNLTITKVDKYKDNHILIKIIKIEMITTRRRQDN